MGFFNKLGGPILYKDSNEMKNQLESLENLEEQASDEIKKLIAQDIRLLQYGDIGEENVQFELMNSFMPMLVLRDLQLEFEDLTAQIDFIVITRKVVFVIECKNLFGNIEVNNAGDFIRTLQFGSKKIQEGIYSPITQNRRHLEILKAIRKNDKGNVLMKMLFEKHFDENYKSIIVLANPKTVLKVDKANKGVRDQIIRCDQLITHMKKINALSSLEQNSDKHMHALAEALMIYHKPKTNDYTSKYGVVQELPKESAETVIQKIEDTAIYQEIKAYRLMKSKEEEVKAYYVFTNAQLEELISQMPESLEDLRRISGFGEMRVSKYGQDLLKILADSKN
ncbi:MAG: HRDC domain-containing protein [Clostridiaceae bacterium]